MNIFALETLAEIWKASGGLNVRVRRPNWAPGKYYIMVGISPEGYAVGWHSVGPIEILQTDKREWEFVAEQNAGLPK